MSLTKTATLQPIPYISFNGNCAEAVEFYAKTLGGTILSKMTFGQMPGAEQMPPDIADRIVNIQLELPGGQWLYAGDCPPHMTFNGIHGIGLALNFDTVEEAESIFNLLAEGGEVNMPFAPTFWAEKFGMVTDKYGVDWMINGVLQKM